MLYKSHTQAAYSRYQEGYLSHIERERGREKEKEKEGEGGREGEREREREREESYCNNHNGYIFYCILQHC